MTITMPSRVRVGRRDSDLMAATDFTPRFFQPRSVKEIARGLEQLYDEKERPPFELLERYLTELDTSLRTKLIKSEAAAAEEDTSAYRLRLVTMAGIVYGLKYYEENSPGRTFGQADENNIFIHFCNLSVNQQFPGALERALTVDQKLKSNEAAKKRASQDLKKLCDLGVLKVIQAESPHGAVYDLSSPITPT